MIYLSIFVGKIEPFITIVDMVNNNQVNMALFTASDVFAMEFLPDPPGHTVTMTQCIQQMFKHQDQIYKGTAIDEITGEVFQYAAVFDGHGGDDCITFIRSLSDETRAEIFGKRAPVEEMAKLVNENVSGKNCGGSTMNLTKIYKDHIECINCGDSQAAVYKDGELIYLTVEHNWENIQEKQRLEAMGAYFTPSTNVKVVDDTHMHGIYSEYVNWRNDGNQLACTQALGSNGKTGYTPHHEVISILPGSTYNIFAGSDGFWDMVIKDSPTEMQSFSGFTAEQGVAFAISRWLQPWEMRPYNKTNYVSGQYSKEEADDVCVVTIAIVPNA